MCTQGCRTQVFHSYRVAGDREYSSRDGPTHTRPYPEHLRPAQGTSTRVTAAEARLAPLSL